MSDLNDISVAISRQEYNNLSMFAVEVGTTGPQGGDAGHGSRVVLKFENPGATTWEVDVDGQEVSHPGSVTIRFGGDSEGQNIVEALEFAAQQLRQAWGK